jgi:Leucine-rich repeat (LRR) protein
MTEEETLENGWLIKEDGSLVLTTSHTSREKYLDLSRLSNTLGAGPIHDVNAIKFSYSFPFLQHLNIRNQNVADLTTVGTILSLRHLDASRNQINSSAIVSLHSCKLLQTLVLNDNIIDILPKVRSGWRLHIHDTILKCV